MNIWLHSIVTHILVNIKLHKLLVKQNVLFAIIVYITHIDKKTSSTIWSKKVIKISKLVCLSKEVDNRSLFGGRLTFSDCKANSPPTGWHAGPVSNWWKRLVFY